MPLIVRLIAFSQVEGYAYFACAAGIMDSDLAVFVNGKFDPRDFETVPDGLFCEIQEKMKATADLGAGATFSDLKQFKDTPEKFCDADFVPGDNLGVVGGEEEEGGGEEGSSAPSSVALGLLGIASIATALVSLA